MKGYGIRPAVPGDAKAYFDWLLAASGKNLVDTRVYDYPTCQTIVVEGDGEPELINSFHATITMEALAPKPGIEPKDEARALRALYTAVRAVAIGSGVREIWFTCADETLEKFILKKGWEKVSTPVYRMKVLGESDPLNQARPVGKPGEAK